LIKLRRSIASPLIATALVAMSFSSFAISSVTTYINDTRGNVVSRTEAAGTAVDMDIISARLKVAEALAKELRNAKTNH